VGPTADNPTLTKENVKENILEAYLKGLASNGQRFKTFFVVMSLLIGTVS
jgi:hypothetical protein